ncbi:MAG: hypothetical protein KDK27_15965 [Leptospiraceae bacterium]|nr:hypothetical protein [Leptospiraceae bacterium]
MKKWPMNRNRDNRRVDENAPMARGDSPPAIGGIRGQSLTWRGAPGQSIN